MFDTKEAFLIDTLEYYLGDISERRCAGLYGCRYNPKRAKKPNSEGCAISRHVGDEKTKDQLDSIGNIDLIFQTNRQDLLPNWMVAFGQRFLKIIQNFHDMEDFWDENENTLSEAGKTHLEEIIKTYNLDKNLFTKYQS